MVEWLVDRDRADAMHVHALRNYERFHGLPAGTATIDQLQALSAGIDGWYQYGRALEVWVALLTAKDKDGWQPIHFACGGGHLDVVEWLSVKEEVSLTAETELGIQPIHCASFYDHSELFSWVEDQGVVLRYPQNRHEWPLFSKKTAVITAYAVPYILGLQYRRDIFDLVKPWYYNGLSQDYYPRGRENCEALGEAITFAMEIKDCFNDESRHQELSLLLNMDVYKPKNGMSGVFQFEITSELGLTAPPLHGVTLDRDCVVLIDKKYRYANDRVRRELLPLITGVMAVWRATKSTSKGIVVLDQTKEVLHFNFDPDLWGRILHRLGSWATDPNTRLRLHVIGQAPTPARGEDEGSMTMSEPFSQVSNNPSPHALNRASERNISESDIQDAKTHVVITLQIPLNHEIATDVEVTRAKDILRRWGRWLVEEFSVTLGSFVKRGNRQDGRFELELVGSENQGVIIKEWLKNKNFFETGLRMQYAHAQRQNQWELVVVEGQQEGQIVVITEFRRPIRRGRH